MEYAIKCYFNDDTAAPVRKIWQDLEHAALADYMTKSGSRPGLTLGVWTDASESALNALLKNFARSVTRIPAVSSFGIATFPTQPAHVFLGVVPSLELLRFHHHLHETGSDLNERCSPYYRPESWVPHSTLAIRCDRSDIIPIFQRCLKHDTRLNFIIKSIGLIETGTPRPISEQHFESARKR